MNKIQDIEKEIKKIHERNERVEADKAWETSVARKIVIFILTYIVISLFLSYANIPNPFINSIVPALAFVLSTLSLPVFKKVWMRYFQK